MTRFKEILPKVLPTGAALLLFFIVSALYFAPQFRGEVLPQHDVQQYEGMAKEIWDNRAQTGEDPQWAGRMFGGMPAYLINVAYPASSRPKTTDMWSLLASFADVAGINGNSPSSLFTKEALGK